MAQIRISSTIKKNPFNYQRSKMIAEFIANGLDKREIFEICYTNNKVNIASLQRRQEVTNEIYRRLIHLEPFLLERFLNADIVTSKFILVYAIAKVDELFFDFLSIVYRESLLNEKKYISHDDFDNFFAIKSESNSTVASWKPATIQQLAKGYRRLLIDASLGVRNAKLIYTSKVFIHPEIKKYIEDIGDYRYLQAILGER